MITPPIHEYCDSPTIRKMCGLFGDRFERMPECDRALLLWSASNGQMARVCAVISESLFFLATPTQSVEPVWLEFRDALTEEMAQSPSLAMQLIHALSAPNES